MNTFRDFLPAVLLAPTTETDFIAAAEACDIAFKRIEVFRNGGLYETRFLIKADGVAVANLAVVQVLAMPRAMLRLQDRDGKIAMHMSMIVPSESLGLALPGDTIGTGLFVETTKDKAIARPTAFRDPEADQYYVFDVA